MPFQNFPYTDFQNLNLDWILQKLLELLNGDHGSGAVESVNGKTGVVVLNASDVGALPANTHIPDDAIWRGEWNVAANYAVGDFVSYGGTIYRCNTAGIGIYPDEETGWDEWFGASNLGAYVKPSSGIPLTDLAQAIRTSLAKADSAYQKPSSGIPASDLAGTVRRVLMPDYDQNDGNKFLRIDADGYAIWDDYDTTIKTYINGQIADAISGVDEMIGSGVIT